MPAPTNRRRRQRKSYGERECACGATFTARNHNANKCERCRAVQQAATCSCGERFYRRDGADNYCPRCHVLGFGDKRWHPGDALEEPCAVCGELGLRVADRLELCAECLAATDAETHRQVDKVLRAHRIEYVEPPAPAEQPAAELSDRVLEAITYEEGDASALAGELDVEQPFVERALEKLEADGRATPVEGGYLATSSCSPERARRAAAPAPEVPEPDSLEERIAAVRAVLREAAGAPMASVIAERAGIRCLHADDPKEQAAINTNRALLELERAGEVERVSGGWAYVASSEVPAA
jgi:hypothetical protein